MIKARNIEASMIVGQQSLSTNGTADAGTLGATMQPNNAVATTRVLASWQLHHPCKIDSVEMNVTAVPSGGTAWVGYMVVKDGSNNEYTERLEIANTAASRYIGTGVKRLRGNGRNVPAGTVLLLANVNAGTAVGTQVTISKAISFYADRLVAPGQGGQ